MQDRSHGALNTSPLFPTQAQGSGGEGKAVSGMNTLVSESIPPPGPWCQGPCLPSPPPPQPTGGFSLSFCFSLAPQNSQPSSEPFNFDAFWRVSSAGVLCSLFFGKPNPCLSVPQAEAFGLLGWPKCSFRFFHTIFGKTRSNFWPAQYNDRQRWPLASLVPESITL